MTRLGLERGCDRRLGEGTQENSLGTSFCGAGEPLVRLALGRELWIRRAGVCRFGYFGGLGGVFVVGAADQIRILRGAPLGTVDVSSW